MGIHIVLMTSNLVEHAIMCVEACLASASCHMGDVENVPKSGEIVYRTVDIVPFTMTSPATHEHRHSLTMGDTYPYAFCSCGTMYAKGICEMKILQP
jgi:hypothetical protein